MIFSRHALSAVVAANLCVCASAMATSVTLTPPSTDLRIVYFGFDGGGDFGALSVYHDGEGQAPGSNDQNSLIQFDLSSIPAGATITSASLGLTHDGAIYYTGDHGKATNLFAATKAWDATASWNNYSGANAWTTPGGDGLSISSTVFGIPDSSGIVPVSFDVTGTVQGWVSGSLAKDGFLLTGDEGNGLHFYISGPNAPTLTINYTVPEPASLGVLGLGAITLVARRRRD